jgi:putative hemin transport protein
MPDGTVTMQDPRLLAERWQAYRQANPRSRTRDTAAALGVSEGELLATAVSGRGPAGKEMGQGAATRLLPRWKTLVEALPRLGTIMALTRNEHCVHEKTGRFDQIQLSDAGGVVLDPQIDLRIFFSRWHHGFALTEPEGRRSLQVFDADGTAVHKIYLKQEGGEAAFDALVAEFAAPDQAPGLAVSAPRAIPADKPDSTIDAAKLTEEWRALKDTHDFFGLLKRHGAGREQAFRLVPDEFAREVPRLSFSKALTLAANDGLPIMVFVGSPGVIQIHTGPVQRVQAMGPWQNVLDADFNLHLMEPGVARCWLVRKPTTDGIVTSLEIYDKDGQQIAWMFGARKPGIPEKPEWPVLAEAAARP